MKRIVLILVMVAVSGFVEPAWGEITPNEVRESIRKGVQFLKSRQNPEGSWEEWPGQLGGLTSLCTLALLNCGVDKDDPNVAKALEWLRKLEPQTTYAVALQTMVFCKGDPKRDLPLINRNARWIEKHQMQQNPERGSWGYPMGGGDNSNAQFALLGLHEAERAGISVREQTWRLAKMHWEESQQPDGAWGYKMGQKGTGSMTCAGIASMIITSGAVRKPGASVVGAKIVCCGCDRGPDDARIERGIQWLARNFSVARNPGYGDLWSLYYLYGVERVGRLSARRFIGEHDWYREGADYLVTNLGTGDYWVGRGAAESNPLVATSMALLFLSKGRRPILISKLAQGNEDNWNLHAGDVAHLTRFAESQWKTDMTWQVVDLQSAGADDLAQSPVVYLVGEQNPLPSEAAQREALARKLRGYLDRGGFLLAEGYCKDQGFDEGFRELMTLAFPEPEYRLHLLPPEHPIWRAEKAISPKHIRPLWGIDYGCRTSVVYAPREKGASPTPSLSCLWELAYPPRGMTYPEPVQEKVEAGMWTGLNILAYATNRELLGKEEVFAQRGSDLLSNESRRGRLDIAHLRHAGGCRAAPRALVNLLEAAEEELGMPADRRARWISAGDDVLFDYHLAFMQGRTAFQFTPEERKNLRTFLDRGGLLYANAICANEAFAGSFRREMAKLFSDRSLEPIPPDDPIWTEEYGGFDLKQVRRRIPRPGTADAPLEADVREGPPMLQGIKLEDRWAVIFSDVDISCALEKHDSMECKGYLREDAARISLNVILYSLQY